MYGARGTRVTTPRPTELRAIGRYRALRALGYGWAQSRQGQRSIAAFCALVAAKGTDPAVYGELSAKQGHGGWPRTDKPCRGARAAELRRARYRELRALGATSYQASEGCGCDLQFARIKRELGGVFKKAQHTG